MKIAFFDTHKFEQEIFKKSNEVFNHEIIFFDTRLTEKTVSLAAGIPCVCAFVNDRLNEKVIQSLSGTGTRLIALRSAGYNHIDLNAALACKIKVVRVPEYSPYAVAEHALALILSLNRKIHRAYHRVRDANFSLEGLVGFDLHKKNIGIIGTGRIGAVFAKILTGFGCQIYAFDKTENNELKKMGIKYVPLDDLLKNSDIISLHIPLNSETRYLINDRALSLTKKGVMIINTSRGALINTKSLIQFLKNGHIGYAGLDVYEEEEGLFFGDFSEQILQDDQLARLLTFPNVLMTSHQGFLTQEALQNIAMTTLENISDFENNKPLKNEVK